MAYIDTSVLVAYYCPEPLSRAAEKAIRGAASPTISPLVEVEMCSALAIKMRAGEMDAESARRVLSCFRMHCADGVFAIVSIGAREHTAAFEWMSTFSTPLRTLDALHLAAAFANDLTLLTADSALARSAKHFGVAQTDRLTAAMENGMKDLRDWRGEVLARVRGLIKQACPDVVEEVKWRKPSNPGGVPVWSHAGILCTGETYKDKVKLTFAQGAALEDPAGLFNAGLDGNTRRAIDIHEGDRIDEKAFQTLIRAAVAMNTSARVPARRNRPVHSQKSPESN